MPSRLHILFLFVGVGIRHLTQKHKPLSVIGQQIGREIDGGLGRHSGSETSQPPRKAMRRGRSLSYLRLHRSFAILPEPPFVCNPISLFVLFFSHRLPILKANIRYT